jgi:hypothetical protein
MDSIDHAINQAIISLHYCQPNSNLWMGPAATSFANLIEALTRQLEILKVRLNSWQM